MKLGTVALGDSLYIVIWRKGDRITIPALGAFIATDTKDREEALEICRRNLKNFVEC